METKQEELNHPALEESNALSLKWAFGFNKDILGGVHNLSDDTRNAIFYVSAHSGVIYDYVNRRQRLLQGHCNPITCCCVSEDKRWIATADAGPDSMIVVWDSVTGTPIKTIFNPHPSGVIAMDMSPDAMFLVTLSHAPLDADLAAEPQTISLWEWTVDREGALYSAEVTANDLQTCVRFNTSDIREIVTNGAQRVIFWNWEQRQFKYYSPPLSQQDFKQAVGAFTQSMFVPESTQAITATADGDIILWDRSLVGMNEGFGRPTDRRAVKIIRLSSKGSINFITHVDGYLVSGGADGAVRFYDFQFRIVAWYEDLDAGAVTSVSFANLRQPGTAGTAAGGFGAESDQFTVPDFTVGTRSALVVGAEAALFEELLPERRRGTLLVQGFDAAVHGLAAHPFAPRIAVSSLSGTLQLWDYAEKRLLMVRQLDASKMRPQCLAFDPRGRYLALGCTNGTLKVVNAEDLSDTAPDTVFRVCKGAITEVRFSLDGQYLATADTDHCVGVYIHRPDDEIRESQARKAEEGGPQEEEEDNWIYIGKHRSHSRAITGLEFGEGVLGVGSGEEESIPLLVSVGEDRRLVEYDLLNSSVAGGVVLRGTPQLTEQGAAPTACMWHPKPPSWAENGGGGGGGGGEDNNGVTIAQEDMVVTASDEYKIKLWNAANKTCRRTLLGPTYGGPVNKLLSLPALDTGRYASGPDGETAVHDSEYVAYCTHTKVMGLMKLPLDGNPNKSMGLIAHPGELSGMCTSFDGRFLISSGGKDLTVNLWAVDTSALDATVVRGGQGVAPFVALIHGGGNGEFFEEIVDFFYYAQLRSQGESCTKPREAQGMVKVEEIPNLMRALGYYPTEMEVRNMCSEVRYSRFTQTGEIVDGIGLHDFIKLYVNHRPVFGIGKRQVEDAFQLLGASSHTGKLHWKELVAALQTAGEKLTDEELTTCLHALVGREEAEDIPAEMDALQFADSVLGFEDYDAPEGQ